MNYSPHGPMVPSREPAPEPAQPSTPIIQQTKGHVMIDVSSAAAAAEKVVESVASAEPMIATIASMVLAIPYIERALNDIAAGNGNDFMNALIELLQHNTKGQPNSDALKPQG